MGDFCGGETGPYRILLRGARETVVGTRAAVYDILDAMAPEDREHATVQPPIVRARWFGRDVHGWFAECREGAPEA